MNKVLSNIIIISLNENFGKIVSNSLAKQFSMNFVDCKDEISENIVKNDLLSKSFTMQDLERQEEEVLKNCIQRKNIVLSLPYDLYRRNKILFEGQAIYYLRLERSNLTKKDIISSVSFVTRDEYLKANATKTIFLDSLDENIAVQKVRGEIK